MADNLDTIEQHDAIKFIQKVGEELPLVRQAQSRCAEITMLAWTTLSAASKNGLSKRLLLSKAFFERGIMKLVPRWQKCIASDGDYVEK